MSKTVLSQENWQQIAREAIDELPPDIRSYMDISVVDAHHLTVDISDLYLSDEGERCFTQVQLTYWPTMRERGWPKEHDGFYQPGGRFAEQADWPVLSLYGQAIMVEEGLFPGRVTSKDLKRRLQVAVLEELVENGVICKLPDGLYVRDDDSQVLDWQIPDPDEEERYYDYLDLVEEFDG